MPWTAEQFRSRHNHYLSPAQSAHAARIANAILKRSGDEGMSIATANKLVKRDIGGPVPSAMTASNPNISGFLGNLNNMSPDQLRVLAMRSGNSSIGQMAQQVLQRKLMMPNVGSAAAQAPAQAAPMAAQGFGVSPQAPVAAQPPAAPAAPFMARGGALRRFDFGGGLSMSAMSPWWTRSEAREAESPTFYSGATGGRSDQVNAAPPAGSYVLPADVVSHLGEGNSIAGAAAVQRMLGTGPYGVPLESMRVRGSEFSRMPAPPHDPALLRQTIGEARGGSVDRVPVKVSDGEILIPPAAVARIGGGSVPRGHRALDAFVKRVRADHIKTLRELPGPAKN